MATKTDARVDEYLSELETIVEQVTNEVPNTENRAAVRQLERMIAQLDAMPDIVKADTEAMGYIVTTLTTWAESLEPASVVTWDRDTTRAKFAWLGSESILNPFTSEQQQRYNDLAIAIAPILAGKRSGTGTGRTRGGPAPSIEGHPPVVTLQYNGIVVSNKLRGDAANSLSNVMVRARDYANKNDIPAPGEDVKQAFSHVTNGEVTDAEYDGWSLHANM